ncbi:hypothetical protein [Brytella acorum]|uniref:hypothetical protein n=1 Tax=Brytella acorum TaxID=2959299 RepID=UPI0038D1C9A4
MERAQGAGGAKYVSWSADLLEGGSIATGKALVLRDDYDAAVLRVRARATKPAAQVVRPLALAEIYEGALRGQATLGGHGL